MKPSVCPIEDCECIHREGADDALSYGTSIICFGKMLKNSLMFKANGVNHDNTHNLCIWTPFRGWARHTVNASDMWCFERIVEVWRESANSNYARMIPEGAPTRHVNEYGWLYALIFLGVVFLTGMFAGWVM